MHRIGKSIETEKVEGIESDYLMGMGFWGGLEGDRVGIKIFWNYIVMTVT